MSLADFARIGELGFAAPERLWWAAPAALLLLAPLLRRRSARAILLRVVIAGALVAVLLEPFVPESSRRRGRLVVLADVSPSVGEPGRAEARALLDGASDEYELIAFGARARSLGTMRGTPGTLAGDPADATDIAAALRLAATRALPGRPTRVVLLSDGRATEPGAERAARGLRGDLWAHALPRTADAAPPALRALAIELPPEAARREPFAVVARVEATAATTAVARLLLDGETIASLPIELTAGANEVRFDPLGFTPGFHDLQLLLEGDRSPADNVAATRCRIPDVPRVLCLAATARETLVGRALEAQGFVVETAAAATPPPLHGFDAVVCLPDAPREALDSMANDLDRFIGHGGGGLLAIGGSEGPGLARFAGTPFAFLLPLAVAARPPPPESPPAPQPRERPRVEIVEEKRQAFPISLCLVVDRSGSMHGAKLARARAAAAAAASALTPEDRISIVAFGTTADVLVEPRAAGDARALVAPLRRLEAGGSTAMFEALRLAYAVLEREPTPIRHLVLLSDGIPSDEGPWRDLVTRMAEEKITLSTVGIGFDIDKWLLGRFATWGRGRYWSANHPHTIPKVVTQDTRNLVAARDRRGEDAERNAPAEKPEPEPPRPAPPDEPQPVEPPPARPIVAEPAAPREMLLGIDDDALPDVAGAEEGEPRFAAWVAARAGTEGPPLLAYWRLGLGTVAALTVDPEAPGGRALREHPEFSRLVGQLVRSLLPDARGEPFSMRLEPGEERLVVRLIAEDGRPRTDLSLEVAVAGEPLPAVRFADRYEVTLPPRAGAVPASVRAGAVERRFVLAASTNRERAAEGADRAALLRLVEGADRLDAEPEELLRVPERIDQGRRRLSLPFLLLAAILLPLDAWLRRITPSGSR